MSDGWWSPAPEAPNSAAENNANSRHYLYYHQFLNYNIQVIRVTGWTLFYTPAMTAPVVVPRILPGAPRFVLALALLIVYAVPAFCGALSVTNVAAASMPATGNTFLTIRGSNFGTRPKIVTNQNASAVVNCSVCTTNPPSTATTCFRCKLPPLTLRPAFVATAQWFDKASTYTITFPWTYDYVSTSFPQPLAIRNISGPGGAIMASGSQSVTVSAASFAVRALSQKMRIDRSGCAVSAWISDSTTVCKMPQTNSRILLSNAIVFSLAKFRGQKNVSSSALDLKPLLSFGNATSPTANAVISPSSGSVVVLVRGGNFGNFGMIHRSASVAIGTLSCRTAAMSSAWLSSSSVSFKLPTATAPVVHVVLSVAVFGIGILTRGFSYSRARIVSATSNLTFGKRDVQINGSNFGFSLGAETLVQDCPVATTIPKGDNFVDLCSSDNVDLLSRSGSARILDVVVSIQFTVIYPFRFDDVSVRVRHPSGISFALFSQRCFGCNPAVINVRYSARDSASFTELPLTGCSNGTAFSNYRSQEALPKSLGDESSYGTWKVQAKSATHDQTVAQVKITFLTASLQFSTGDTNAFSTQWMSDSSVGFTAAPGVGQGLRLAGLSSGFPVDTSIFSQFSYPKPIVESVLLNSPHAAASYSGNQIINVVGSFFSIFDYSPSSRLSASALPRSIWVSDTQMYCRSPVITAARSASLSTTVDRQVHLLSTSISYSTLDIDQISGFKKQAQSTGSLSVVFYGKNFGNLLFSRAVAAGVRGTPAAMTLWKSMSAIVVKLAPSGLPLDAAIVSVSSILASWNITSFNTPDVVLSSTSKIVFTGSSRVVLLGASFSIQSLTSKLRIDSSGCPSSVWMSDSTIVAKSMSQIAGFYTRALSASIARLAYVFSATSLLSFQQPVIMRVNSSGNISKNSSMLDPRLTEFRAALKLNFSCDATESCPSSMVVLSLEGSSYGTLSANNLLNASIVQIPDALANNRPILPCAQLLWSSDSSLHCRIDELPVLWSFVAFPKFAFETSLPFSIAYASAKNDLHVPVPQPVRDSLAVNFRFLNNRAFFSNERVQLQLYVENNSSVPYLDSLGYVNVNVSTDGIFISNNGVYISAQTANPSVLLPPNEISAVSVIDLAFVSTSANNVSGTITFRYSWYSKALFGPVSESTSQTISLFMQPNPLDIFEIASDIPTGTTVEVLGGFTSNSTDEFNNPTNQFALQLMVNATFQQSCDAFEPLLLFNVSLICQGLPIQSIMRFLSPCAAGQSQLIAILPTFFTSPFKITSCFYSVSLHASLAKLPLLSASFDITFGSPVTANILGTLSAAVRSGEPLFTSSSGCISIILFDKYGFTVARSEIQVSILAKDVSSAPYELGVLSNYSFVSLSNASGVVNFCGIFAKRIVSNAYLYFTLISDGAESIDIFPANSTFSVNGSGLQAAAVAVLNATNVTISPGQPLPAVNLTLTDTAGNVYQPVPSTFIRISVIPSAPARRLLTTAAETAETCPSGGPQFVPVISSDASFVINVTACSAGLSTLSFDLGQLINGSFVPISTSIASFPIVVSKGAATFFRLLPFNTTYITHTQVRDNIAVMCLDAGRNVVACNNFTFSIVASSSMMPISVKPSSFSLSCNESGVAAMSCLIPSFSLTADSSSYFSQIDVNIASSSLNLKYDGSNVVLFVRALCSPGYYVVQRVSSDGVCDRCSNITVSNISDALSCYLCPPGSVPSLSRSRCDMCLNNTHAPSSGTPECLSCPLNSFASAAKSECLSFQFRSSPPTSIPSGFKTQLPCIDVTSNIRGLLSSNLSQGLSVRVVLSHPIFPIQSFMPDSENTDSLVVLQNSSILCQSPKITINSLFSDSFLGSKYAFNIVLLGSSTLGSDLIRSQGDIRAELPFNVTVLARQPVIESASPSVFDFTGGTSVTLTGKGFNVDPNVPSFGSSICIFTAAGRTVSVNGKSDDFEGRRLICNATEIDINAPETGGLMGPPFTQWRASVVLSDSRKSDSVVTIRTRCTQALRYLNSSLHCSRCPPNSVSTVPDATECVCAKGSFGTHRLCIKCPSVPGFNCFKDNMTKVVILPGFFLNAEKFLSTCSETICPAIEPCPLASACPGGEVGGCLSTEENCYTSESPGCSSCCKKFFKNRDGICVACPKGNYVAVFIIILLILVAILSLTASLESPALVSSIKGLMTVLTFVQSFVSLRFLNIDWPPVMLELFAAFKPLTFSLDFVRPECSVDFSAEQKLYGVLFVPISCCVGVFLANVFTVLISVSRIHRKMINTCPPNMIVHITGGVRTLLHCLFSSSFGIHLKRDTIAQHGPVYYALNPRLFERASWDVGLTRTRFQRRNQESGGDDSKKRAAYPQAWLLLRSFFEVSGIDHDFINDTMTLKKSASGALSVLVLSYVGVIETALPILDCFQSTQSDGTSKYFLRSDRNIECSSQSAQYRSLVSMAAIGLAVYGVAIPALFQLVVWSKWGCRFYRLEFSAFHVIFGFCTTRYKRKYIPWEILVYFKKTVQIAIPLYYASSPVQQTILLFIFESIFSVLMLYHMPFSSRFLNMMEICSCVDIVITVMIGIFFTVEYKGEPLMDETTKKAFGILLVCLCAMTLIASVMLIVHELYFMLRLHRNKGISSWMRVARGVSGDAVKDRSLFLLFNTLFYNPHSNNAVASHNKYVLKHQVSVLRDQWYSFLLSAWFRLVQLYASWTYMPTPKEVFPYLAHPAIVALETLHRLTIRVAQICSVGICIPEDQAPSRLMDTKGANDPPFQVSQKIAEIDEAVHSSLSDETCRYVLAILISEKFRDKDLESDQTRKFWSLLTSNLDVLISFIAKVNLTSQRLQESNPAPKPFLERMYKKLRPDCFMPVESVLKRLATNLGIRFKHPNQSFERILTIINSMSEEEMKDFIVSESALDGSAQTASSAAGIITLQSPASGSAAAGEHAVVVMPPAPPPRGKRQSVIPSSSTRQSGSSTSPKSGRKSIELMGIPRQPTLPPLSLHPNTRQASDPVEVSQPPPLHRELHVVKNSAHISQLSASRRGSVQPSFLPGTKRQSVAFKIPQKSSNDPAEDLGDHLQSGGLDVHSQAPLPDVPVGSVVSRATSVSRHILSPSSKRNSVFAPVEGRQVVKIMDLISIQAEHEHQDSEPSQSPPRLRPSSARSSSRSLTAEIASGASSPTEGSRARVPPDSSSIRDDAPLQLTRSGPRLVTSIKGTTVSSSESRIGAAVSRRVPNRTQVIGHPPPPSSAQRPRIMGAEYDEC